MSNGKGGLVFLSIMTIAALGLSGYLLVDKFFISPGNLITNRGATLVGLWDQLEKTPDGSVSGSGWYVNFTQEVHLDTSHVEVSLNNSQFRLRDIGIYRITLTALLLDCDPSSNHWIVLTINGTFSHFLERTSISANPDDTFWFVSSTIYVNSSGQDLYRFYCYSYDDPNGFRIYSEATFNQLAIEFMNN